MPLAFKIDPSCVARLMRVHIHSLEMAEIRYSIIGSQLRDYKSVNDHKILHVRCKVPKPGDAIFWSCFTFIN